MEQHEKRVITSIQRHTQILLMNGLHLNFIIIMFKQNST